VVLPQGEVYKRMPLVAEVGGRRRAARANVFDVLRLIHVGGCGKINPKPEISVPWVLHGQEGAHRRQKFPGVNATDPSPTNMYMWIKPSALLEYPGSKCPATVADTAHVSDDYSPNDSIA
jgi:hypothetical protein